MTREASRTGEAMCVNPSDPGVFVPEGPNDRSPTPPGLGRDRSGWSCKVEGFGCAVVCEGDLARSAWKCGHKDPSRRVRYDKLPSLSPRPIVCCGLET